jgi:hypothetical protein
MSVEIAYQFEVMASGKIAVPGCEPASELSSKTLTVYMSQRKCGLVDVKKALAAIPGSYLKFGSNFFRSGYSQKWFVIPVANRTECPCEKVPDYFAILHGLIETVQEETSEYDACNLVGMGFCPSPDFNEHPAPESSPYRSEGTTQPDGHVLPPVPDWMLGGQS